MSIWGRRSSAPTSTTSPLKPSPGAAPKSTTKPTPKLEPRKFVPTKELIREAKKAPVIIPGTGGKLLSRQEHVKMLQEHLPHKKIGTHLTELEAKTVLRNIRREEFRNPARKFELNRRRKTLEGDFEKMGFKVKGKY